MYPSTHSLYGPQYQRGGPAGTQMIHYFGNEQSITYGPYDPIPMFGDTDAFINQADEIDRHRLLLSAPPPRASERSPKPIISLLYADTEWVRDQFDPELIKTPLNSPEYCLASNYSDFSQSPFSGLDTTMSSQTVDPYGQGKSQAFALGSPGMLERNEDIIGKDFRTQFPRKIFGLGEKIGLENKNKDLRLFPERGSKAIREVSTGSPHQIGTRPYRARTSSSAASMMGRSLQKLDEDSGED